MTCVNLIGLVLPEDDGTRRSKGIVSFAASVEAKLIEAGFVRLNNLKEIRRFLNKPEGKSFFVTNPPFMGTYDAHDGVEYARIDEEVLRANFGKQNEYLKSLAS